MEKEELRLKIDEQEGRIKSLEEQIKQLKKQIQIVGNAITTLTQRSH